MGGYDTGLLQYIAPYILVKAQFCADIHAYDVRFIESVRVKKLLMYTAD